MVDRIYADPRLASVYDAFEHERDDLNAYVAVVDEFSAHRIVDLGCGTGSLALRLAASGHVVTGVDPAEASLVAARAKLYADRVAWIHGDAGALPGDASADLIIMTGNTAQAILDDDAWHCMLDQVRATLAPHGRFVFESRRPDRREWEDWAARPPATVAVSGVGTVERRLSVTEVNLPLVSFRFAYRFPDDDAPLTSDSTVRFRHRKEIEATLIERGFCLRDVREAPDRPGREYVFIAAHG